MIDPQWIRERLRESGKTQRALAQVLGIDPSAVNRLLKGERRLKVHEVPIIEDFFGASADSAGRFANLRVPEVDVRAGAGGGGVAPEAAAEYWTEDDAGNRYAVDQVKANWGLPEQWVREELKAHPNHIRIVEVLGDSMAPTINAGDRVMIDTAHLVPSPPGIYAVWDGFGVVVKRIEILPLSEPPRVKLISDNKNHGAYELTLDEARIIGRLCGKISAL